MIDRLVDDLKVPLFEGYLNGDWREYLLEDVSVPNEEVRECLENKTTVWLSRKLGIADQEEQFQSLADLTARLKMDEFRENLRQIVSKIPSLLCSLNDEHHFRVIYYVGIIKCLIGQLRSARYVVIETDRRLFAVVDKPKVMAIIRANDTNEDDDYSADGKIPFNAIALDYEISENLSEARSMLQEEWRKADRRLRNFNLSTYGYVERIAKIVIIFHDRQFLMKYEIIDNNK